LKRISSATAIRFLRDHHDITVLLIEHDMGMVMEISDDIIVLDRGCYCQENPSRSSMMKRLLPPTWVRMRSGGQSMSEPLLAFRGVDVFAGVIQALTGFLEVNKVKPWR
jgi:ABC-type dipeptide/oligopeptide/nickel transport system ATPase component